MAERTVWFYEMRAATSRFDPPVDADEALLAPLDSIDDEDRRYELRGTVYRCRVDRQAMQQTLLVASKVRRLDLPMHYADGQEAELDLGPSKDAGLSERTHVAFLPDNVVGVLAGAAGPTAGVVRAMLNKLVDPKPKLRFQQLFDPQVLDKLQEAGETGFRIGTFSAKPDADLSVLEGHSPRLRRVLGTVREEFDGLEMRVILTAPLDKQGRPSQAAATLLEEVDAAVSEHLQVFDDARMTFQRIDEGSESVNFLNERLGMKQEVVYVGDSTRSVTESSARRAISGAYDRLRPRIRSALDWEART